MTIARITASLLLTVVALAPAGCETHQVNRVEPGSVLDYQTGFDEDDAREVSNAMIADALQRPWIENWERQHQRKPVVIVGELINNTSDYIDAQLMTKNLERAMLNTERVSIVASADQRDQIRDERQAAQDWSRPDTVKRMAYELGADLMLIGWIGEDVEISRDRKKKIQYYQVSLELVDIESNAKAWIGTHDIEKRQR